MNDIAMPWEALSDAVARVDASGALVPCNSAMRALLHDAGDARTMTGLGLTAAAAEALRTRGETECTVAGRGWRLRLAASDTGGWLLANETSEQVDPGAAVEAAARARALAALAVTFVHDLNNHLNLALAYGAQLQAMARSPDEARLLEELAYGTRQGALLTASLARALSTSRGRRTPIALAPALREATAAIAKPCKQSGITLRSDEAPPELQVRANAEDLAALLLQTLLALVEAGPKVLTIRAAAVTVPIANGRPRSCVQVTLHAEGLARGLPEALARAANGELAGLDARQRQRAGLAQAAIVSRRLGGELLSDSSSDASTLTIRLPRCEE